MSSLEGSHLCAPSRQYLPPSSLPEALRSRSSAPLTRRAGSARNPLVFRNWPVNPVPGKRGAPLHLSSLSIGHDQRHGRNGILKNSGSLEERRLRQCRNSHRLQRRREGCRRANRRIGSGEHTAHTTTDNFHTWLRRMHICMPMEPRLIRTLPPKPPGTKLDRFIARAPPVTWCRAVSSRHGSELSFQRLRAPTGQSRGDAEGGRDLGERRFFGFANPHAAEREETAFGGSFCDGLADVA